MAALGTLAGIGSERTGFTTHDSVGDFFLEGLEEAIRAFDARCTYITVEETDRCPMSAFKVSRSVPSS